MRSNYVSWLFVAAVVLIPFGVYGVVRLIEQRLIPLPVLGEEGHRIADFVATNQQGRHISRKDLQGKIVVADFFFTRCPNICPKMTYNLKRVQAYAAIDKLMLLSFSVDPEHDTPSRLAAYTRKMDIGGNWHLLTGDKPAIYRLARNSFLITATDGDGGPGDFMHSENLILLDRQQRIRGFYKGTDEDAVNQLVKDIRKLAKE